jgi:hypothetical protein
MGWLGSEKGWLRSRFLRDTARLWPWDRVGMAGGRLGASADRHGSGLLPKCRLVRACPARLRLKPPLLWLGEENRIAELLWAGECILEPVPAKASIPAAWMRPHSGSVVVHAPTYLA